jgi:hypothetical protein
MDSAFNLAGGQHAGNEVGADAESFQFCPEGFSCDSAVERRHHSDPLILEFVHDSLQIIGANTNVAVVDEHVIMLGDRVHLDEIADFVIRSEKFVAHHELDLAFRKLMHEPSNQRDDDVLGIAYTKNDFKLRIQLNAMAAKTLIRVRICPTEGFEDRNRWTEASGSKGTPLEQKPPRAQKATRVISQTAESPEYRQYFEHPH